MLYPPGVQYKKSVALPAEALPFTAADRNRKSDCTNFFAQKFVCHRSERLGGIAAALRSAFLIFYYAVFLCIHFSCVSPAPSLYKISM